MGRFCSGMNEVWWQLGPRQGGGNGEKKTNFKHTLEATDGLDIGIGYYKKFLRFLFCASGWMFMPVQ